MRDFEWLCNSNLSISLTLAKDEICCYDELSCDDYDSDHYNHHGSLSCNPQMIEKVVKFVNDCHERIVQIEVFQRTSIQFLDRILPKLNNVKAIKICTGKMPDSWYTRGRPGFQELSFWDQTKWIPPICDTLNGKPVLEILTNLVLNMMKENREHLEYIELSDPFFDFVLHKNFKTTKENFPKLEEIYLHGCKWQRMNGGPHHWVFKRILFLPRLK